MTNRLTLRFVAFFRRVPTNHRTWTHSAKKVWMGPGCTSLFVVGGLLVAIWAFIHVPIPGVSIAILASLAAIMSLRPEMGMGEKFCWIVAIGLLLSAEVRSIRTDKLANENRYLADRKAQNDAFEKVIGNVTGGDSYAVVIPDVGTGGDVIPLAIKNRGVNVLSGVMVTILHNGILIRATQDDVLDATSKRESVGSLHPGDSLILGRTLQLPPNTPTGEVLRLYILIGAQNFTTEEFLNVRKVGKNTSGTDSWEYSYKAYRMLPSHWVKPGEQVPKNPLLEQTDWTTVIDPRLKPPSKPPTE